MAEPEVLPTITGEEPPIEEAPIEETPVEEEGKTKTVKNFWERLDEVFNLSKQTNQNIDEIIGQFPETVQINQHYSSALFQPDRISLCSNDDLITSSGLNGNLAVVLETYGPNTGHFPQEMFNQFRIRLSKPLRNVKSIQLLSAVIPNATTNIPDTQTFFWYYRIRSVDDSLKGAYDNLILYSSGDIVTSLGNEYVCIQIASQGNPPTNTTYWKQIVLPADTTRPNYYDLSVAHLAFVYIAPSYLLCPDSISVAETNKFNRTYEDYQDLVNALNYCASNNMCSNNNDVQFEYNPVLNKIVLLPQDYLNFFYLPCGYEDLNIPLYQSSFNVIPLPIALTAAIASQFTWTSQSILNTRLGFTWNGGFPNPVTWNGDVWSDPSYYEIFYWYLRISDPILVGPNYMPSPPVRLTFNNYPDLVNTSCVRIYADFTFGSTQDSLGSANPLDTSQIQGLLSIVPVNAANLGVGFYQNNFNNPLTKIPKNIPEIGITMLTDQGTPYYLPNSATVLLELAIEYY